MKAVLDASVAISWVHPEDVSVLIRGWLIRWTASGGAFVVPRHFWLEVVNSLAVKHRYRGAMVLEAIHELRHLPIETVETDDVGIFLVIDAVEKHGLTAYDALYVSIAEQLEVPIVTMDQAMRRAAGALALDPRDGPRLSEVPTRYGEQPRVTWPDYSGAAAYLSALRAEVKRTQERRATGRGPDASPG